MRSLIHSTIEQLKLKVKENLERINQNQVDIRELLNQPVSVERNMLIERNYDLNKALLNENNDFINLQLALLSFLEKYMDLSDSDADEVEIQELPTESLFNESELFELTVEGKLSFDYSHPRFEDEEFFNRLISYYTSQEAYEKCSTLLDARKRRNALS